MKNIKKSLIIRFDQEQVNQVFNYNTSHNQTFVLLVNKGIYLGCQSLIMNCNYITEEVKINSKTIPIVNPNGVESRNKKLVLPPQRSLLLYYKFIDEIKRICNVTP